MPTHENLDTLRTMAGLPVRPTRRPILLAVESQAIQEVCERVSKQEAELALLRVVARKAMEIAPLFPEPCWELAQWNARFGKED